MTLTPRQRAALRDTDPEPRWWFSRPGHTLLSCWWPIQQGSDEYARATIAFRVPFGFLVIPTWHRLPEFRGPCARCGRWEHVDGWDPPHCTSCQAEVDDYIHGCLCPSILEDDWEIEDWPNPDCAVHAHLETP